MEKLERISKIYQTIQLLNKQIAGVQKLATQLAESENIIYFSLSVEDLNKYPAANSLEALREKVEESLRGSGMHIEFMGCPPMTNKPATDLHRFKLESKTALICLGVIIQSWKNKRDELMQEIESLMSPTEQHAGRRSTE